MVNRATRGWVLFVGIIAWAAIAASCSRTPPLDHPGLVARYERLLIRESALDSGCLQTQVLPQRVTRELWVVRTCNVPREYTLQCGSRRCRWQRVATLNEAATGPLSCPPHMIQQQVSSPTQRSAYGCAHAASFELVCNGEACGWTQVGEVQAAPLYGTSGGTGQVVVSAGGDAGVPEAPPPAAPSTNLQQQVEMQRDALLSCVEGGELTLRLRWSSDGSVVVVLPQELTGTVAAGCIETILGSLTVQASQAGEVVVPLQ
ncbi:MAG: hypothetical protein ACFCGT_07265 [Sandaracinaceae bacterium]